MFLGLIVVRKFDFRFRFVPRPPVVSASAVSRKGVTLITGRRLGTAG